MSHPHHHKHHHHPHFHAGYLGAAGIGLMDRPAPVMPMPGAGKGAMAALVREGAAMQKNVGAQRPTLRPVDFDDQSGNELRPRRFAEMIGQAKLRPLLERLVESARATGRTLDHALLLGSAGTGKTTVSLILANELGRDIYALKAPVAQGTLEELAKVAKDGDVVFVDEIHMQMSGDRRGITQAADPENFYALLEDKRLSTTHGVVQFPDVTFIGATTDAGLLPEPFLARFPLQPRLDPYTVPEMAQLAEANAKALRLGITPEAALFFARASKRTPRIINRYLRNARSLGSDGIVIEKAFAVEIITELNSTSLDGLDRDQQNMLRFLLKSRREDRKGNVIYQASIGSIATACGKSRDQKTIALYTEPYLIERGLVGIAHGGRTLTDKGIERARRLQ